MADRPQAASLLHQNPELERWLRTQWSQPIKDYRLYWDDTPPGISPIAEHAIAKHQLIMIRVSQKLCPTDQLLALAYEIYNAQGHFSFEEVKAQAGAGKITRKEYINEIDKREYAAGIEVKKCFPKLLPLTTNEVAATSLYKVILELPDDFQEYQAWCNQKHDPNRARTQELYGRQYDELVEKNKP